MHKYTVIYGEWFQRGAHRNSITKFKHIETDNLREWMDTNEEIPATDVWFIFEGHCQPEGSFADSVVKVD